MIIPGFLNHPVVCSKVTLGPLYFCCGLQSIIDRISDLNPTYQKWYMDDGGIVGPQDLLLKVWDILKTDGPPLASTSTPMSEKAHPS